MKCPNCGNEVYAYESINNEYYGDSYHDTVEGECESCHKLWRWTEVFAFDHDENIEEIADN